MDSMSISERLVDLRNEVRGRFATSSSPAYYTHTLRVANYARQIADAMDLDVEFAVAAALVHDLGMSIDPSFVGHPTKTLEVAPEVLRGAGFDGETASRIALAASSHHPEPTEVMDDVYARIVFDSDWLDLVGVLGFLRWFGGVPADLSDLIASAELFAEIVSGAKQTRGRFFYTDLADELGSRPLQESLALCDGLVVFSRDALDESPHLRPTGFSETLLG